VPFADARRGGAPPPGQYHRGSESQHRFGAEIIEEAPSPEDDAFGWIVYTHGGQRATALDAVAWARECVRRGAGEILLTSIDRDGARAGYDLELTRAVSSAVAVPVIASGGAGRPEHVRDVLVDGGADAALVAGILHDGLTTVRAIKQIVRESGLPVRSIE
jgi:cyclase